MNPRARRQNNAFKQRVEQLVAEGKFEKAWNLLTDHGWVPRGSGYQEHYPHGLTSFAKIYPDKEILRSRSGRLWAWKVSTPEEAYRLEVFIHRMQLLDLPQIAVTIKDLEGSIWWLNHDAADGR